MLTPNLITQSTATHALNGGTQTRLVLLSQDTYAEYGYTAKAVETIDGTNQLVFARTDGYLWKWSLDITRARQTAELIEGGTNDFYDAEFAFATDMNEAIAAFGQLIEGDGTFQS